ncbi:hypothetical protein DE146DRAFT_757649 [Phaeosphaeria sp. MPI-PUGE-AT-0046c]|nr:hypothetical protein DE146DRAFT_757649 [Phaeosphaeria sp. MPI-PUGE-AT-0046c]OAK99847.1 hypothetical protein IQ06DRAFT_348367 [Stagonospora sp. SRC1lsM3a]
MKFTTIVATVLSMAAFAIAAPVSTAEIDARQNHGMCVKSEGGQVTQIPDC